MQRLRAKLAVLGSFLVLAVVGGCASPVPGQIGVSGKRLVVTIKCYGPMYSQFYYYLVINRVGTVGDPNGRGPIPVLDQAIPNLGGFGNGFATGSPNATNMTNGVTDYGLTDYVVYNNAQPNTIRVYHITGDPNTGVNPGKDQGSPVQYTLPDLSNVDVNQQETLTFQLPLTQLVDPTNKTQQTITNEANAIHYIQVNIIATNVVPTNQAVANGKQVDSMGNSTLPGELSSFLTIDLTQNRTYTSDGPFQTLSYPEPQGDVYPFGSQSNPPIDLQSWSIAVTQQ